MAVPILLIIALGSIIVLFALFREPMWKIAKELGIDFLFTTAILIVINLFYKVPKGWTIPMLAIGIAVILILRVLTANKSSSKPGGKGII